MSFKCYKCAQELNLGAADRIGRSEGCTNCHTDLRCCMMCQFHDLRSYNECKEPVAQRIVEKEKGNYCDYYKVGNTSVLNNNNNDLLNAADLLFKK